jgi:hypothetical protein
MVGTAGVSAHHMDCYRYSQDELSHLLGIKAGDLTKAMKRLEKVFH